MTIHPVIGNTMKLVLRCLCLCILVIAVVQVCFYGNQTFLRSMICLTSQNDKNTIDLLQRRIGSKSQTYKETDKESVGELQVIRNTYNKTNTNFEARKAYVLSEDSASVQNEHICQDTNSSITVLILISSAPLNMVNRNVLRKTWLTHCTGNTGNVRYAFLLGQSEYNADIVHENYMTRDIIMGDFNDTYHKLTLKTLYGYQWATKYCSTAKFVMKCDDDSFVNIPGLLNRIQNITDLLQAGIGGFIIRKPIPVRDPHDRKWFVSFQTYQHESYPPYCLGGPGYITSVDVVCKIVNVSKEVPYFPFEDVYIGMCIHKLNYSVYNIQGVFNRMYSRNPCHFKNKEFICAHRIPLTKMEYVWTTPCLN